MNVGISKKCIQQTNHIKLVIKLLGVSNELLISFFIFLQTETRFVVFNSLQQEFVNRLSVAE